MSEEGFLSRWSRRKRAAEAGLPVAEPEVQPPVPEPAAPPPPVEPAFDPASLPPIEDLTAESDFTAFLRKEVPEAIKRAALRKAWAIDPAIRDFVGPADYAWDFNAPDGVPGFALELGGDVRRLLAQAIGLDRDEEAARLAAVKAEGDAVKAEGDAAKAEGPAPAAPAVGACPAAMETPAEVPPAPAPAAARRHGSALPS
ncbi:DUF3306 domain-containing protein [Roseomonas eburnea]|uniref:DUF3306 domain-containing protein n=1 Tax=Neoroseomonas eburnea TaxID=1346889 RepID=A0A9X9X6M9_9PROT|nr:DUF3306 domain-containing protein [Neoroseomonas eburnea]MBR0679365.1 DUF3306 domain-containing protein [Neoroseomonas eburnea]